jgi:AcrR family transcriptional regulator
MRLHCYSSGAVPRRTDHDARRRRIAEALWRVAADQGLDAVSLRHVAAEARVSMGQVQHYFRTKDEMLRFAVDAISERVAERIELRVAALTDDGRGSPRTVIRAILVELLPLDEARRLEASVGFAFLTRAAVQPGIATGLREQYRQLREFVAGHIRDGQRAGTTPAGVDPDQEAVALLALVDGLSAHVLADDQAQAAALAAFDGQLRRLFPDGPDRLMAPMEMLTESVLEARIVGDQRWQAGAAWGSPRPGHPEGMVAVHIRTVLDNLDQVRLAADARRKLRLVALLHDTFKREVDRLRPRTGDNHHAAIARRFAERLTDDEDVLELIELHDEAYNAWAIGDRRGDWSAAEARAVRLIDRLSGRLDLYLAFYRADNAAGDKDPEPLRWFVRLAARGEKRC